ncbi:MAG TPA: M20/M25/M40 family metallo-hydrolase [Microvirga sp.]|nr:M20/M25/M40 family metallo-hydrolase [Microvirga sp.]
MIEIGAVRRCGMVFGLALLSCGRAGAAETGQPDVAVDLRALQEIAAANGGNRADATPGFERSVEYVSERLRSLGYQVRVEEFTYPFNEERSPPRLFAGAALSPAPEGEARSFTYSGGGDVTAPLRAVDLGLSGDGPAQPSTSACEPADFAGFERGAIALVRRGTCPFFVKVQNAIAAGAVGVVAMNEGTAGQTDSFTASLGRPTAIPVVGVSYGYGVSLAEKANKAEEATARLIVDIVTTTRASKNVVAETPAGDDRRPVAVVGAHLDSVRDGPGLNDNGSGVAAVLAAAANLAGDPPASGGLRVRFGFWGAEEVGLLGSRNYVSRLSEEERKRIALYVNLDMVGSRNFARLVLADPEVEGVAATAARAMLDHFAGRSLPAERRGLGPLGAFSTDMASFKGRGIPTIGLYTGSAELKREDQVAAFGGTAGQPHDTCYHRACDTIANVNAAVVEELSGALTAAIRAAVQEAPQ